MTLTELQSIARDILKLQPAKGYSHQSFYCRSGGAPRNDVGVPEVSRTEMLNYHTVRHGWAYHGTVEVECRPLGVTDADNRDIYEASNGTLFVFRYYGGSPENFDCGYLSAPNMTPSGKDDAQ